DSVRRSKVFTFRSPLFTIVHLKKNFPWRKPEEARGHNLRTFDLSPLPRACTTPENRRDLRDLRIKASDPLQTNHLNPSAPVGEGVRPQSTTRPRGVRDPSENASRRVRALLGELCVRP